MSRPEPRPQLAVIDLFADHRGKRCIPRLSPSRRFDARLERALLIRPRQVAASAGDGRGAPRVESEAPRSAVPAMAVAGTAPAPDLADWGLHPAPPLPGQGQRTGSHPYPPLPVTLHRPDGDVVIDEHHHVHLVPAVKGSPGGCTGHTGPLPVRPVARNRQPWETAEMAVVR